MATELLSKLRLVTKCNSILSGRLPVVTVVRQYAKKTKREVYIEHYTNPVFRKEQQNELIENNEMKKLSLVLIKAPGPHVSCSVYHDELVDKFTNHVMEMGKKALARSLIDKGFVQIKRKQIEKYHLAATAEEKENIELNPKVLLHQAVENCKPLLVMTPVKRGGITYQVPGPVTEKRSKFLAMKWLLEAINTKERTVHFPEKFAWEVLDAANNVGTAVKRKQDLHRMCEANRAYAHYRW